MDATTLGAQGVGVSGLQVHASRGRKAAVQPPAHGRGLDAEMLGGSGQAAEVADDPDGFGVAGLLVHAPILAEPKDKARSTLASPTDGHIGPPMIRRRTISGMGTGTLKDRLAAAMEGMPRGAQAKLAAACGVSAPSVNGWLSGETKTLGAETVFAAARFLKVNPEWLATGRGSMHIASQEGVKDQLPLSQSLRSDAETMRKAFLFARTYLAARGIAGPVDAYPGLVASALEIISTIEAEDDKTELVEVLGRMAERFREVPDDVLVDGGRG